MDCDCPKSCGQGYGKEDDKPYHCVTSKLLEQMYQDVDDNNKSDIDGNNPQFYTGPKVISLKDYKLWKDIKSEIHVCRAKPCHCYDGLRNFDETALDCGGSTCWPCECKCT